MCQFQRFIVAGLFNTSLSYGIYACSLWLGFSYPFATFLSIVAGVCVGFLTQGYFVFRRLEADRFSRFVLVWLLLWGLNVIIIGLLMPLVGRNAYVAGAAAIVPMVGISFLIQKHLVFAERRVR